MRLRVGFLTSLILFAGLSAFAQYNASLQGTIQDPSGGLIPHASVTLENNGTHAKFTTSSNDQGFYRFDHLPAGVYTLTVKATGFQTASITDLSLAADLPQSKPVTLQPGNVQTTVTVTAATTPVLQTADASVSATISSQAVMDLPTFGRDPYELIRTAPGMDSTGGRSGNGNAVPLGNTTGPGQSNVGIFQTENQLQVSSAGQRVEQNVFYIDGVNVNSLGWGGAAVVTPNTESVQDMTVITADYDAADGRGSGAHIKTTTKAGTNNLHGSAVFLYQDPNFNAYNKWGGPSGALPTRVQNNYRQYAGSLGGPIIKDKFFYFLSYEGLHNKSVTYGTGWVTTPQYRQLILAARPNSILAKIFNSVNANPRINAVLTGPSAGCSIFGANAALLCRQVPGGLDVGSPGPGVGGTRYYPNPNAASAYLPGAIGGGFDGIPDLEFVQYYLPNEQIGNQYNGRFDFNLTAKDLLFVSTYITHLIKSEPTPLLPAHPTPTCPSNLPTPLLQPLTSVTGTQPQLTSYEAISRALPTINSMIQPARTGVFPISNLRVIPSVRLAWPGSRGGPQRRRFWRRIPMKYATLCPRFGTIIRSASGENFGGNKTTTIFSGESGPSIRSPDFGISPTTPLSLRKSMRMPIPAGPRMRHATFATISPLFLPKTIGTSVQA